MNFQNIVRQILNEEMSREERIKASKEGLLSVILESPEECAVYIAKEIEKGKTFKDVDSRVLNIYLQAKKIKFSNKSVDHQFLPYIEKIASSWVKGHNNFDTLNKEDFQLYIGSTSDFSQVYIIDYLIKQYRDFKLLPKYIWPSILYGFTRFVRIHENFAQLVTPEFYIVTGKDDDDTTVTTVLSDYIATCVKKQKPEEIPRPWLEHLIRAFNREGEKLQYSSLLSKIFSTGLDGKMIEYKYVELPEVIQQLLLNNSKQVYDYVYNCLRKQQDVDPKFIKIAIGDDIRKAFYVYKNWKKNGKNIEDLPIEARIGAEKAYKSGYINEFTDSYYGNYDKEGVVEDFESSDFVFRGQSCNAYAAIEIGYNVAAEEYEYASSSIATEPSIGYTGNYYVDDFEVQGVTNITINCEENEYNESQLTPEELHTVKHFLAKDFIKKAESYLDQFSGNYDDDYSP